MLVDLGVRGQHDHLACRTRKEVSDDVAAVGLVQSPERGVNDDGQVATRDPSQCPDHRQSQDFLLASRRLENLVAGTIAKRQLEGIRVDVNIRDEIQALVGKFLHHRLDVALQLANARPP